MFPLALPPLLRSSFAPQPLLILHLSSDGSSGAGFLPWIVPCLKVGWRSSQCFTSAQWPFASMEWYHPSVLPWGHGQPWQEQGCNNHIYSTFQCESSFFWQTFVVLVMGTLKSLILYWCGVMSRTEASCPEYNFLSPS